MVRQQDSPRGRRRRSPPPGQPRLVEPPLFKVAVSQVREERARRLRTHFFNGRRYPRAFANAFQSAVDQTPAERRIGPLNFSGGASVEPEAELALLPAHGCGGGSARSLEGPPRRGGCSSGDSALEDGNGGASLEHVALARGEGGGSLLSQALRRAGRSSGAPGIQAGNGGPCFDQEEDCLQPTAPGEGGGSARSPQATSPPRLRADFDEINRVKDQEAAETFLAELSAKLGLRLPPPPLPLSEREPTPPPPTSPPPPLQVPQPTSHLETVCTREDADKAVAAAFAGEEVRVRVSPNMTLREAKGVREILAQGGLLDLVEDPALLAAKVGQAIWLTNEISRGHSEVKRLDSMLSLPWLL